MKFFTLLLLSALLFLGTINAQKGVMKVEPSIVIAFPSGVGINTGFGINGTFFYGIDKNIDITGTIGYVSFGTELSDWSFSTIPLLFGGRYSFDVEGNITPYAAAEIGLQFVSTSTPTYNFSGQTFGGSSSSTEFGFGFGGGAYFKVNESIVIDANLQYNTMGDGGEYFGIRGGVVFGI